SPSGNCSPASASSTRRPSCSPTVDDVAGASAEVRRRAGAMGGYLEQESGSRGSTTLTVRIPAAELGRPRGAPGRPRGGAQRPAAGGGPRRSRRAPAGPR
ncbi:DUF4349 domain-containing protein, partial [Saccharopolyspora indica]|uniref:DUF4349 domain-containing protein n=1 Tax=Saccharopolyspora indica TaxID=1229659 RepID=UPI002FE567FD